MFLASLTIIAAVFSGSDTQTILFGKEDLSANRVEMSQLIQDLHTLPPHRVRVKGYVGGDWEGLLLYENTEDCAAGTPRASISVSLEGTGLKAAVISMPHCAPMVFEGAIAARSAMQKGDIPTISIGAGQGKLMYLNFVARP